MKILFNFEKQNKTLLVFLGFLLIGIIGFIDYLTGYEYAFSLFYVLPVYLITWTTNRKVGFVSAVVSAIVWLVADIIVGHPYSHPLIPIWNALIRFFFFFIIMFLLSSLKDSLQREKELSNTDFFNFCCKLTLFLCDCAIGTGPFQRYQHPFTIAYLDIDDFKSVNDQFDHARGDEVLQTVANAIKKIVRKSDVFARLGGDEFALFFPETDQETARSIFSKIHTALVDELQKTKLPVTFSIGVVTCKAAPATIDELIKLADELMYSVKLDGKNAVKFTSYEG